MQHAASEHTGLLRLGLAVTASVAFWQHADPEETVQQRRLRAASEEWFGPLSASRHRYLLNQLTKRFSATALQALKRWQPDPERQAPLVCHWHLQWSDPLYRDFVSSYLVSAWARPDPGINVAMVDDWLSQRGSHVSWSVSTRRRLASGLLAAAREAGFLKGHGRDKELRTVTVDAACHAYLRSLLATTPQPERLAEELFLSGTLLEQPSAL